jgi:Family of unknown function (DUF6719)
MPRPTMRVLSCLCGAAALLVMALPPHVLGAEPEKTVKREPPKGQLRAGQCVLVDDGECGIGRIKRVCSGTGRNPDGSKSEKPTSARIRTCIPRSK